jgi:ApaG protein
VSTALTRGVRITVRPQHVPERSTPGQYFFAYTVTIANEGTSSAQLVSRHWLITDAHGRVQEVKGPGVVGQQPTIAPGDKHEYTSFCILTTPHGTMRGTYQMVRPDGSEKFDAEIAPFILSLPNSMN